MAQRRVEITRTVNIADVEDLGKNPLVRKAWVMPWNFTLLEFYDPIYERLDDPSSDLSDPTQWTDATRARMNEIAEAKRKIIGRLYTGKPRHWQGNKMGMLLGSVVYRIVDDKKMNLPWLGYSVGWETARVVRICGRLGETKTDRFQGLLQGWSNWLSSIHQAPQLSPLSTSGSDFSLLAEFPEACGDQCMALYTALVASEKKVSVEAVGFFSPEEQELRFRQVGALGEIVIRL